MHASKLRRVARRMLLTLVVAGLSVVAGGCAVPNPGPSDRLPANYVAPGVGVSVANIQYGPDPVQVLNLYLPGTRPAPMIVFAHSGGWTGGDRSIVPQAILREVTRGYAVASIEYHLSPQSVFPAALQDTKTAIRWAKTRGPQYGLRADEVFVAGWSAGGNLAAMAALTPGQFEPTDLPPDVASVDSRVRGAVTLSGVLDLGADAAMSPAFLDGYISKYLGSGDPNLVWAASPINHVTPSAPPMYIAQGLWDGICPPGTNGLTMAVRYLQAGRVSVGYYDLVDNQGHNADVDGMNTTVFDYWLDAVRDGRIS